MRAFRVVIAGLSDVYNELFLVVGLSLLWWLAVISIIGGPPATTALAAVGYRLAQEQRVNLDDAKAAFLTHFWLSWRLGIVSLVVIALIIFNILFYLQFQNWLQAAALFFIYLTFAWAAVLMYAHPLISGMEQPSLRQVLRNAAVIAFANPLFNLLLLLCLVLVIVISILLPVLFILILPGTIGIIGARALADRLQVAEERVRADAGTIQ